jgi:SAM-dependent methyltransferase
MNASDAPDTSELQRMQEAFLEKASALEIPKLELYHWYHTVDLGDGLVTPGQYDFRGSLASFGFREDMTGMRVLDVGSATGFFTFEFERRGADVTSIELPSLHHLDRFPGQTLHSTLRRLAAMRTPKEQLASDSLIALSAAETYFYHLDGPFQFCYRVLRSKARRVYSTVYELREQLRGEKSFDLVFLGDVLVHTIDPLRGLAEAAALCGGELILSQVMPVEHGERALVHYVGGENPEEDDISWFLPNKLCFLQMLKKLGFAKVEEIGRNTGRLRPSGYEFDRPVIRARR